MATSDINVIVKSTLDTIEGATTYHDNAPDDASYPYIVYSTDTHDFGNLDRDDVIVTIDIWDKANSSDINESIADSIVDKFQNKLLNNNSVLCLFFVENRLHFKADKDMQHEEIQLSAQIHERSE